MAALMGARTVVVGLRPGVVSALVELNVDTGNFDTLLDLDDAFALFESLNAVEEDDDEGQQALEEEEPEDDEIDPDSASEFNLTDDVSYESKQYSD